MAEQLVNEFTVNRPIDEAWAVITDVERIAPCLPGAQLQEIEGDIYRGIVKIKLGSITPQFKGQATFVERDDTSHRAVLKAEGRDTGGRGNAAAEIAAKAESLSPTSTRVVVTTDLHITGRVAQFGRGIIGDVSKKLMAQFAGNLNTMLDERPTNGDGSAAPAADTAVADGSSDTTDAPDAAGSSGAAPAAAAAGEDVPTDDAATEERARSAASAPAASTDAGEAAATGGPNVPETAAVPASRVRKIDSPATEPVDLAGVAGPAVLKRVVPVVALLLVLLLVLRRRR